MYGADGGAVPTAAENNSAERLRERENGRIWGNLMLISCILASPARRYPRWMMRDGQLSGRYIAISLFAKRPRYRGILPQSQTPSMLSEESHTYPGSQASESEEGPLEVHNPAGRLTCRRKVAVIKIQFLKVF